jgi:pre-mRNA-splicing helicase BRR2
LQVETGSPLTVTVNLSRGDENEDDESEVVGKVICPRFYNEKIESWWLIVGDNANNTILSIKRLTIAKEAKVTDNII